MSDPQTDAQPTNVRSFVVAVLCVSAMIAYAQRNTISIMEKEIAAELRLDKHQMGWVMSAFFLTYAAFQLPTGWLAKTAGTRRALTLFVAAFSAAAGFFAVAGSLPALFVSRLAMGAAQSGIFPCAVVTIAKWLPERRRSLASGLLGAAMSVGGAAGVALIGSMMNGYGWRLSYFVFCVPGFLFAACFWFWFRDDPREHGAVNTAELAIIGAPSANASVEAMEISADDRSLNTPWARLFTSVPVMAFCAQQVFRAVGYIFFATWFGTYLREAHHVDSKEAGVLNSLPLLAIVVGSPLGGVLSDWILNRTGSKRWSRQGVAAGSQFACFALILLSMTISDPTPAVLLISAGSFCAAFGGQCAYTTAIDLGGRHVAMVFSLMNMGGNIGAFVFPIVVPYLLNEDPNVPGGGNWELVLFVFAAMYLAAGVCWLLADPTASVDGGAE
jgi:MFS transporter, ACS family, D-galactonate transporter